MADRNAPVGPLGCHAIVGRYKIVDAFRRPRQGPVTVDYRGILRKGACPAKRRLRCNREISKRGLVPDKTAQRQVVSAIQPGMPSISPETAPRRARA